MELLSNPLRITEDLQMIATAMSGKWNISDENRAKIVERLIGIVEKSEVEVVTKNGIVTDETKADINSIRAAALLRQMVADDQPKVARSPVQIGVNIDNRGTADEGRGRIATIAARLGADGVPGVDQSGEFAGGSQPAPGDRVIIVDTDGQLQKRPEPIQRRED